MTFEQEMNQLRAYRMTRAKRRWAIIKLCTMHGVKLFWVPSSINDNGYPRDQFGGNNAKR